MANLDWLDGILIAGYFILIALGGYWATRKKSSTEDFYRAGRSMPWPAVLLSITATEISAVTFLGVPGTGYHGDLTYLQFGVGSLLARFVVAYLFLQAFYQSNCVSIYQYMRDRFGGVSHRTTAIFFLVSRINASSVRLLLASVGLSVFFGMPIWVAVLLFVLVALIYTTAGGIRAVIWTDCLQAAVFIGGGLAAFYYLVSGIGWSDFWSQASEEGLLKFFHWMPESPGPDENGIVPEVSVWGLWFSDWNLFYLACLNGFVMTIAALGCDQDLTQRMLTCKNVGLARRSVILSGFLGIPVAALFVLVGVALTLWIAQTGNQPPDGVTDNQIFAWFIAEVAPAGLKGLLFIGIMATAMSSLDSAVNALSSSVLYDLAGERSRSRLRVSRLWIVFFGVLLAGLAIGFSSYEESFVWLGFKIVGITYGSLLGIFLLARTSRRGSDCGNLFAMLSGCGISSTLLLLLELEIIPLGWTWIVLINVVITYLIGFLFVPNARNENGLLPNHKEAVKSKN